MTGSGKLVVGWKLAQVKDYELSSPRFDATSVSPRVENVEREFGAQWLRDGCAGRPTVAQRYVEFRVLCSLGGLCRGICIEIGSRRQRTCPVSIHRPVLIEGTLRGLVSRLRCTLSPGPWGSRLG